MKSRVQAWTDAGHRVQLFLTAHADEVSTFLNPQARVKLDEAVEEAMTLGGEQLSSTGLAEGETSAMKEMRKAIFVAFLEPITDIHDADKLNDSRLVVHGKVRRHGQFLADLEGLMIALPQHEAHMIKCGMPRDLIARLRAAIDELIAMGNDRGRHWGRRAGATGGLDATKKKVAAQITVVEGQLLPLLKNNASLKRDWEVARRINKRPITPRRGGKRPPPTEDQNPT